MNQPTGPVLLVTAWHLPTMRSAFRHFWRVRRLERRSCRPASGCLRVHRWVSRRSILLTSWWSDRAAAERWLASDAFAAVDAAARRVRGAGATVELRGPDPDEARGAGGHTESPPNGGLSQRS